MDSIKKAAKKFFTWLINLMRPRYEITVSWNKEYGDADDRIYISKRVMVQKDRHLKFIDEDNKLIEYRSAGGLNYIIKKL